MARTAKAVTIIAALLLVAAGGAPATVVHWTPAHEFTPDLLTRDLAWGDLDSDGDDDVSAFSFGMQHWNTGCPGPPQWQGEAIPYLGLPSCGGMQSTSLGDVDADGDLDLVCACWLCCSFRMVWNVGTPQEHEFLYGGAIAGDPNAYSNARAWLCDIDADGDLDLVAVQPGPDVVLYENTGTPETPYWVYSGVISGVVPGDSGAQLAVGDLDGDGDLDIVGGTHFSPLQCWENVGTPHVWSYMRNDAMLTGVTDPMNGAFGLALPDVDCDGDPDLLIDGWTETYLYLNESITPVGPTSWGTIKALYR